MIEWIGVYMRIEVLVSAVVESLLKPGDDKLGLLCSDARKAKISS